MNEFDNNFFDIPSIEVPKIFFSEKENRPFSKCSMCGSPFFKFEFYFVEKAYKKNHQNQEHELIFEYALCRDCLEDSRKELSEESKKNIELYFKLYVDIKERNKELLSKSYIDLNNWISECIITGKPIEDEEEYIIGASFLGNRLILDGMPYAISEKAILEMQEILSKKTKKFLDGFQERVFPPDVRERVPDGSLIIL